MAESHNRTLICSVLFIDIVEYSRKPVVEQIALKDRFNELLSEVLRGVAVSDRIILDTGDGAAISFIGDPEDALFVAADLRDTIAKETEAIDLELGTRMGVNLGPVRLVKDINGQPNIIGDGINVAQRVMSFAQPGQLLVSRSYFEVVSRLSEESFKLFKYEGSRTDKHIREHEVYTVGDISALHRRSEEETASTSAESHFSLRGNPMTRKVTGAVDRLIASPRVATLVAVGVILAIAITGRLLRDDSDTESTEVARAAEQPSPAPTAASAASDVPSKRAAADTPRASQTAPVETRPTRAVASKPASPAAAPISGMPAESKSPASARAAVEDKPSDRVQPAAQTVPEEPATVSLAISPWGQVFVNGRMRGVSPPLQELELPPGKHRIEVRNDSSTPHVVSLNAKAGERLRIKHKFQ